MTVEIEMTDEEFKTLSEYAAEKNFSLSEFFLNLAREKFEDAEWDCVSQKLMERNKKIYKELAK